MSSKQLAKDLKLPSIEIADLLDRAITATIMSIGGITKGELYKHLFENRTANWFAPIFEAILLDLQNAGYIAIVNRPNVGYVCHITYRGVIFCRKPISKYFRGRPFHYEIFEKKLSVIWRVVKIISIAIFSIATIYLTYKSNLCNFD